MSSAKIELTWVRPDMVDGAFQDSVDKLLAYDAANRQMIIGRSFQRAAFYIDDKRNDIVRDFLRREADYLMSIDTDIEFEPEQFYALVEEAEVRQRLILSGLYFSFLRPESWVPDAVWFSKVDDDGCLQVFGSYQPGEIVVPLAACGMGFCLIHRSVFEEMAKVPEYANDDWTWFGRDIYKWKGQPKHHGEDVCFCVRAGKLGIQTWGHKGIVVRHHKKIPIDFHFFRAMVDAHKAYGRETA